MTSPDISVFQSTVWQYFHEKGRHDLPWRLPEQDGSLDPYKILVSELMLQQTQVPRVIPKFVAFTGAYSSFKSLATAPLGDVLRMWSGLGYNRRAKFLLQTAQIVARQHGGQLPKGHKDLVALPGIGNNTAGAIRAYAFNEPVVFIETNIRTVFIHHFFGDEPKVTDAQLTPLIEQTLPPTEVRNWYWALMDYGTNLKQTVGNLSRNSASYSKQSAFHGSRRKVRGEVLKLLTGGGQTLERLQTVVGDERLASVLEDLIREGFIELDGSHYRLAT
jgi:A/G-specific adenine glycosylase